MTKSNLYSLPSVQNLIREIKEKPELRNISDDFIEQYLYNYLKKHSISLSTLSKKSEKLIVKDVRSYLRSKTGRFALSNSETNTNVSSHRSTNERSESYPELIRIIKNIAPESISDLGCGLNPIFIAESFPKAEYYAYDIREDNISEVKTFFKQHNITGEAKVADITKIDLPSTDVCLILKVLDVIETRGHKQSEILLNRVPSKRIIVSFSTKTISGRPMNYPERGWIERLCSRLNYNFKKYKTSNEIFYVIEKH